MKIFAIFAVLLQLACNAAEAISIREVIKNTKRDGLILLDQGYSGCLSFAEGSYVVNDLDRENFEFTHAWLNDRGIGKKSAAAQAVVVGILSAKHEVLFRSPAIYIEKLPPKTELLAFTTIAEFEKVFGPFRSFTDGWSSESEMHSSLDWIGFSCLSDGSLRVVTVFLWTVNRGNSWEIENRKIGDGIFKPTGAPPKPQSETTRASNSESSVSP